MKKIISVLLITAILFAFSLTCFSAFLPEEQEEYIKERTKRQIESACSTFSDLDSTTEDIASIAFVYDENIMVGVSSGKWETERIITKAELIVLYYNLFPSIICYWGEDESNIVLPFSDVKGNEYYCEALKVMYKNGIIVGNEKREFEPNRLMRAEEAAAILGRIIEFFSRKFDEPGTSNVLYLDEISDWALKDYIRIPNIDRYGVFDFDNSHPKLFVKRRDLAVTSHWFFEYNNPIV